MPMPMTSPDERVLGSQGSSVSSVIRGSPYDSGVAAARTYSHRGVITPTPKLRALGLMRCTFIQSPVAYRYGRRPAGAPFCHVRLASTREDHLLTGGLPSTIACRGRTNPAPAARRNP